MLKVYNLYNMTTFDMIRTCSLLSLFFIIFITIIIFIIIIIIITTIFILLLYYYYLFIYFFFNTLLFIYCLIFLFVYYCPFNSLDIKKNLTKLKEFFSIVCYFKKTFWNILNRGYSKNFIFKRKGHSFSLRLC